MAFGPGESFGPTDGMPREYFVRVRPSRGIEPRA